MSGGGPGTAREVVVERAAPRSVPEGVRVPHRLHPSRLPLCVVLPGELGLHALVPGPPRADGGAVPRATGGVVNDAPLP